MRSWVAVLSGNDADVARSIVRSVETELAEFERGTERMDRDWGLTLLSCYLRQELGGVDERDKTEALLESLEGALGSRPLGPGLHGGACGIGWLIAHARGVRGGAAPEYFSEIDSVMVEAIDGIADDNYDLISGAVGLGVYFLERLPDPLAAEGVRRVVAALCRTAVHTPSGTTWFTPPSSLPTWQRRSAPLGYYNLGVAHGVAGVLGFLADAKARLGEDVDSELIRRVANWILEQRLSDGLFPCWVHPSLRPERTRVAWCYGELGMSLTLLSAAAAIGSADLQGEAIATARLSARRVDTQGTLDGGLCHGAAGNAHLFNRLFQATGDDEFRRAAIQWYCRAAGMRSSRGVGGFVAYRPFDSNETPQEDPWQVEPSFLAGSAGIALAFLAAVSTREPVWDRILLASVVPWSATP